jgi:hypothetical protein
MAKKVSAFPPATVTTDGNLLPLVEGSTSVAAQLGSAVSSTSAVRSLSDSVATLNVSISSSSTADRNRANHTGTDPAAVIVFADGQTLEAWRAAVNTFMAGGSASAPINTVAPPAPSGSTVVGSTLSAQSGTWTGASTYAYQWRRTTPPSGTEVILGATGASYVITAADRNTQILYSVTATGTNNLTTTVTSAVSSVVTATLPTISVAPAVTPSGTQAIGVTLSTTNGTWNNGTSATYEYQWFVNGALRSGAVSNTFTPITGMEGAGVRCDVRATTAQGTSAWASSNTVTMSSTATVVNTVAPAWSGVLYFGATNDFTEGTWTGSIDATRTWQFFRNSETSPYVSPPNTVSMHTPRSPAVVGDTLYIEETVTETATGTTYTVRSSGATIQAVPATLALVIDNIELVLTQGVAITPIAPIHMTGGTPPYAYYTNGPITGSLPPGLSINGTTGVISGTPSGTWARQITGVWGRDSVTALVDGLSAGIYFTVNAAGASALPSLPYPTGTTMVPTSSPSYNDGDVITGTGGVVKLNRVADPGGSGKLVYTHRVIRTDSVTGGGSATTVTTRAEKTWIDFYPLPGYYMFPAHEYWMAFAVRAISGEYPTSNGGSSDNDMIVMQTHSESSGNTQPDIALMHDIGRNRSYIQRSWSAATQATTPQGTPTDWVGAYPTLDVWYKYIVRYRAGFLSAHSPATEIWQKIGSGAYTKIVDRVSTGSTLETNFFPNTYNWVSPGSGGATYPRIGIYKWSGTNWTTGVATIACYCSTLYWGEGTGLYSNAEAALAGL